MVLSEVVADMPSPQTADELAPEPLSASEDVPAPSLETTQEVTKSSDDIEPVPVVVLQPTSSTASLEGSARFESDFEADVPPDTNVTPFQVVATSVEKGSPRDVPFSTQAPQELEEPQETAGSGPLPSETTTLGRGRDAKLRPNHRRSHRGSPIPPYPRQRQTMASTKKRIFPSTTTQRRHPTSHLQAPVPRWMQRPTVSQLWRSPR